MIYYFTPYNTEKNVGKYYNDCMSMIPNGSWACFTDGDSMFTTHDFGHQLEEIIKEHSDYDLLTCMTNRVGTKYQCIEGTWTEERMSQHWKYGQYLANPPRRTEVVDITNEAPISGVMILLKKSAWFNSDRFKESGMLGVDNSIHYAIRNMGGKVGLMKGVYLLHYYRNGRPQDKEHLQ